MVSDKVKVVRTMFSLSIKSRLQLKDPTFCCVIDFSAALDNVDRDLLIYALKNIWIDCYILKVIREIYRETHCAVRVNRKLTEWFTTKAGARQGQNESPTVFAAFINSLAIEISSLELGISIGDRKLSILLFADDFVLIGKSEHDLQLLMDKSHTWCLKWCMKVNMIKLISSISDQKYIRLLIMCLNWVMELFPWLKNIDI